VEIPSVVIISGIFYLTLIVAVMAKLLHFKDDGISRDVQDRGSWETHILMPPRLRVVK
jgi:hypothetical protein